jgi:hypothetical protein
VRRKRQTGTTLVLVAVGLVALWCLYWFAAHAISNAVVGRVLAATETRSPSLACPGLVSSGFPFRVDFACREVSFADTEQGLAGALADLAVSAPLYRPGHVSVAAAGPLKVAAPDSGVDVSVQWTAARAEADAGIDGPTRVAADFDGVALADGLRLPGLALKSATAESAAIAAWPAGDKAKAYRIEMSMKDLVLTPDDDRALPSITIEAEAAALDFGSSLGFDPKAAILDWLRQGAGADIDRLVLTIGAFATEATGHLKLSDAGLLSGKLTVRFRNLDQLPEIAEAFRPGSYEDAQKVASVISAGTKKIEDATGPARQTVLNLREGVVSFGIIPIGFIPPVTF